MNTIPYIKTGFGCMFCLMSILISPVQAQVTEGVEIDTDESNANISIHFSQPHQFQASFPDKPAKHYLIRLRSIKKISGNGLAAKLDGHTPIPGSAPEIVQQLEYEIINEREAQIILGLCAARPVQVRETPSLRRIIITIQDFKLSDAESSKCLQ